MQSLMLKFPLQTSLVQVREIINSNFSQGNIQFIQLMRLDLLEKRKEGTIHMVIILSILCVNNQDFSIWFSLDQEIHNHFILELIILLLGELLEVQQIQISSHVVLILMNVLNYIMSILEVGIFHHFGLQDIIKVNGGIKILMI